MQYDAVIFDLDGTLLDTLADIAHAANRALQQGGFPIHAVEAYREFIGSGVATLFRRALPTDDPDETTVAQCVTNFGKEYGANWAVHTKLYEGVADLLDELTQRNLQLAVLSNKPHRFTQLCAEEYLSAWQFEVVLGQRDGVPHKPDPAGAQEIADRLQVPASRCIYLGDSAVDMQTAVNSGMKPIGALWGFRSRQELEAAGAKHLIDFPTALLSIVD